MMPADGRRQYRQKTEHAHQRLGHDDARQPQAISATAPAQKYAALCRRTVDGHADGCSFLHPLGLRFGEVGQTQHDVQAQQEHGLQGEYRNRVPRRQ